MAALPEPSVVDMSKMARDIADPETPVDPAVARFAPKQYRGDRSLENVLADVRKLASDTRTLTTKLEELSRELDDYRSKMLITIGSR